jgi:hypothetical protein
MVTGFAIATNLGVVLFLLVGYFFSCLLLFQLLAVSGIQPSWLAKRVVIAALGFCQTAPIILRRSTMYEAALASGYCFFMAGMYLLARCAQAEKPARWHLGLAGLFLGMTAGCRPNYAPVAVVVLVVYLVYLRRFRHLGGHALLCEAFWFGGPIAACGLALAWYNFARFGSPLELGVTYQLVATTTEPGVLSSLSNVLPGLYKFLVETPIRFHQFPFLELAARGSFGASEWVTSPDRVEPAAGILVIAPLCVLGCLMPVVCFRFWRRLQPTARFLLTSLYAAATVNLFVIVLVIPRVSQRYELDFGPQFLLISLFLLLYLAARLDDVRFRRAAAIVLVAGTAAGAAAQAALSINSYDNMLMWRNPAEYERLASIFGDDDRSIRRMVTGMALQGEVRFRRPPLGTREALVTSGVRGRGNAIFVQYLGVDRIRFGYSMSGKAIAYGPEIAVAPLRSYRIRLVYRGDRSAMGVWLDDTTVLDVSPTYVYPTSSGDAAVGRDEIGDIDGLKAFSGEIRAPGGLQFAPAGR